MKSGERGEERSGAVEEWSRGEEEKKSQKGPLALRREAQNNKQQDSFISNW
jgi:hypothetical protein